MERSLLCVSDGSWHAFKAQWDQACLNFNEDPAQFAVATMPVLEMAAKEELRGTGAFALVGHDAQFNAAFWVNTAMIPGYSAPVMRVRHITLSPHFEFNDYELDAYGDVLGRILANLLELAEVGSHKASHIKIHLPSPAVNCTPFGPDSRHKQKGSSTGLGTGLCLTSIDTSNC